MNALSRKALGSIPLTEDTVLDFYQGPRAGTAEQCLRALCVSHERLRAELEGLQALLQDVGAEVERLQSRLAAALALTDTGSPEFRAAFVPPLPAETFDPALGWRVVERVREALIRS